MKSETGSLERERRGLLSRIGLPEGTAPVGIGLGIAGLCAYGFLTVSGRALGPERYSQLSVLWSATFLLGTGLFLPLEQEIARAISVRRTRGEAPGAVVSRGVRISGAMLVLLALLCIPLQGRIVDRFFDGDSVYMLALGLALLSLAMSYAARGLLSGLRLFRGYGILNAIEGGLRFLPALVLAWAGVAVGVPYASVFAVAPLFAALLTATKPLRNLEPGPPPRKGELDGSLARLVAASVLGQALINLPVLTVKFLAGGEQSALAGRFMAAVVLARVPVVLFQAVQAALVPKLASMAAAGELAEFRKGMIKLTTVVAAVGVLATAGAWAIGVPAIRILFGAGFELHPSDLAFLAAASSLYLLALAVSQGLIALGDYTHLAIGWSAGLLAGLIVTSWSGPLLLRVERGFLAGGAGAFVAMAIIVWRRLGRGQSVAGSSLLT